MIPLQVSHAEVAPTGALGASVGGTVRWSYGWTSLLVGGWTVLVAIALAIMEFGFPNARATSDRLLPTLGPIFWMVGLFINYPHALWSYRLAFAQGPEFVSRHWGVLIALPTAIIATLMASVSLHDVAPTDVPAFVALDRYAQSIGFYTNYSVYPTIGAFLLAVLLVCQMVFSGQHYVLQTYGISLHGARAGKYPLDDNQRQWIRWNLLSLWFVNITSGYSFLQAINNAGFVYYSPRLPAAVVTASWIAFTISLLWMLYGIVYRNWRAHRQLPPMPATAAYVSGVLWMQPLWYPLLGYNFWIVPLGHCVQYLYFVYGVERAGFPHADRGPITTRAGWLNLAIIFGVVAVVGYLGFEGAPLFLDAKINFMGAPATFFILSAFILINIQHYFIDGLVWRNGDSVIRKLLGRIVYHR